MKLQLDFENKIITIEDTVNLGKLVSRLEELLPDWKQWELKQTDSELPLQHQYNQRFDDRTTINPFLTNYPNTPPTYNPVVYTTSN